METVLSEFGRRVRELRLKRGMTQEALANLTELDRSYIGSIERGEKNVALLNIAKLANALDVDLSYLFEDDQLSPRSFYLKRELKKPLEERFTLDVDVMEQVIAWRIAGPINEYDVKQINYQIRSLSLLLKKGEIKLLIDNRFMVLNGLPFVFSPEVNVVWEELQMWLLPFVKQVVVLCNSKLMQNQLDRLALRSGIADRSKHIFGEDSDLCERTALEFLGLSNQRLLAIQLKD